MAAEFSITQFFTVHAKARAEGLLTPQQMAAYGTADSLQEAMDQAATLPAVNGIFQRSASMVQPGGGRRLTPSRRTKRVELRLGFAIITGSFMVEDGRIGGWELGPIVANIFDGWPADPLERGAMGLSSTLEYVDLSFVMRSADLTRVVHQVMFSARAEMFTTPSPATPP